ncbi:hypothetical protein PRZ48_010673 [Zasmidium cellare]|uniref:Uncharacterized protein n=1 Tax=Zasmidium cellare TaxID=395010 RepID=A0ABR0E9A2_ZASCE|nr:hypothetical protein PRZ48_010673 [Zasmidium cellare]
MFGIKISSKGGPEPESQTDFKYVEGIFNEMKFGMDNDATTGSRNPGLYCNTDGWKFYENNAADPWRPAEKISDRKRKQIFPRGAWGFNYNLVMFPDSTSETHGMCKDGVHAETVAPSSFITWCNYGFAVLALSLQPNAVKQWDYLSDPSRETMSLTWVHEFAHFYGSYSETNGLPDKPAVDENGNAIFGEGGVPVKTYGAPYVINLAKKSPRDATHTADAYAWFAVAM